MAQCLASRSVGKVDTCNLGAVPAGVNRLNNPSFDTGLTQWSLGPTRNLAATVAGGRVNVSVTAVNSSALPAALYQVVNPFPTSGNCQLQLSVWGMANDAPGASPAYLWAAQSYPEGGPNFYNVLISQSRAEGQPWGPQLQGQSWVAARGGSFVKVRTRAGVSLFVCS